MDTAKLPFSPKSLPGRSGIVLVAAAVVLAGALLTISCGGEQAQNQGIVPPANVANQNVQDKLKFDSRVDDFDTDGVKLTVNVNKAFVD
ncbi:MAG TPA: hypothetical protein VJX67_16200, partial [Blastocatellia bacterium]|nr:hypothetical protein [Blastocatellia bacterium]